MAKFFDCVRSDVEKKCGINGHSILVDAITAFGCELSTGSITESISTYNVIIFYIIENLYAEVVFIALENIVE